MAALATKLEAQARYAKTDKGRATMRRADAARCARRVSAHRERIAASFVGGCVDCGSHDNLHHHHLEPATKRYTVAVMTNASEATFKTELAKCIVVCADCHKERHRG